MLSDPKDRNLAIGDIMAKILNIDTGKVYSSIQAAARAVGVDPSNVGKVLRGQRSSAGGFRFQRVQADSLTASETESIRNQINRSTAPRILEKQEMQRTRFETAKQAQLRGIQEAIRQANEAIQDYKAEKVYSIGKAVSELIGIGEYIGIRKSGLISSDVSRIKEKLKELDVEQLRNYHSALIESTQKAREQLYLAIQDKKELADQLGLSLKQMSEYERYMPEYFDILEMAGSDERLQSSFVYNRINDYLKKDMEKGDLRKAFAIMKRFFANESRDPDSLEESLNKFEKRIGYGKKKKPKFRT